MQQQSSSSYSNCSSNGTVCEYLSPLPRSSPGPFTEEAFTQALEPVSPESVPLNLSCGYKSNGVNASPTFEPPKPMDIIKAVAQQELMKLKLSRLTNPDISIVNGDHDYDKIVDEDESTEERNGLSNGHATDEVEELLELEDSRRSKSKTRSRDTNLGKRHVTESGKNNSNKRSRPSRDSGEGEGLLERSEILRAETSIIATFIAKVKEARQRKSFGKTYHVIKPRAHLYLPNKCSKKVVQERYDVPSEELEASDDTSGGEMCPGSPFGSRSRLKIVENYIDEQIQLQQKLSSRWEALFQKIVNCDQRFDSDENGCGIPTLTRVISEKNQAIAKSLDECKLMMGMIQDHKHYLIQVAQDWNSMNGF
ncbi:unnamed protein product [Allacma fusca]|uniref:Uncharacterized protein n=1 Tax=Allacma fusca TaxID=39272 RepID=A0A8J2JBU4_9HEXA|nr:unnamed protein product [Allacma fusca]